MVANAERLEMGDRVQYVILVRAGLSDRARYDPCRGRLVETAGILRVAAVGDVGDGVDTVAALQPDRQRALQIDIGDELAVAQVGEHLIAKLDRHALGKPDAGSAAVEPENEARPLRRAAIDMGGHAKRSAKAVQARAAGLGMRETGPPHQRAIAKNPKIAHIA